MFKRLFFYCLAKIYGQLTAWRNALYDRGILSSYSIDHPLTIVIGNLAVGGTGKSPLVAYLAQNWPFDDRIGILSRGYGRKTKGFRYVQVDSTATEVGDEPLAYKKSMPNLTVAVCEKRAVGIEKLQNEVDTLLLDDAFQHRAVKGHLNLVCTTYEKPFFNDSLLPLGRLRESMDGLQRADAIFVNRCPGRLSDEKKAAFEAFGLPVFYTHVTYDKPVGKDLSAINQWHLVAGIAEPMPFFKHAKSQGDILSQETYADHYAFSEADFQYWNYVASQCPTNAGILTTHKDFMRFQVRLAAYPALADRLYYLPMQMTFVSSETEFWTWMKQRLKR